MKGFDATPDLDRRRLRRRNGGRGPRLSGRPPCDRARDVPGLKVGDRSRCAGYGTGDFRGSADGESEYVEPCATQPFHFEPRFHMLNALGPK